MRPENAARTLAIIGSFLLILAAGLRLLSVYVIITDPRLQNPTPAAGQPDPGGPDPALGQYTFSADGMQVRFERGVFLDGGWQGSVYTLNLADGSVTPGDHLPQTSLYEIEEGQVWLKADLPGSPRLALSPAGQAVSSPAIAEDGQALAYIDQSTPGPGIDRLFAVRGIDPAQPVSEQPGIRDVAWSPGNDRLVYIASVEGNDQLFQYDFDTRQAVQLTHGPQKKSSPRFSRDGQEIAFLAAPAGSSAPAETRFQPVDTAPANGYDIYVIDVDGQNLLRLTKTTADEAGLAWTVENEVAFSAWQPHWPLVAYLYAIPPSSGQPRRIYPPEAIESFTCRSAQPGGDQVQVSVGVSNHGSQAITLPLEVSADHKPLDLLTSRSQYRVKREEITLQAGETQVFDWTVDTPEDLKIYLAASIESGVDFPISAGFCQVTPRQWFLPRLPLLRTTLLLWLTGSVLCLPWLRHLHRKWVWAFWIVYAVLLVGLISFESWLLLTR